MRNGILTVLKQAKVLIRQHSPEILTGIGIAGMITAAVTAVKATPKAIAVIEEVEAEKNRKLTKKEIIKTSWKCYIPPVIIGVTSAACIVGANSINFKRNAAIATAYSLADNALKEYKDKVVETIGEKKEKSVRDAITKDKLKNDPVENKEVVITSTGNTLCYDVLSGRYFKSDIDRIRKAWNELNHRMLSEMYISLNDFYYEIGLPEIKLGEDLGWNIEKGYIDLEFGSHLATDGTPCLCVSHNRSPIYGFNILSLH